MTGRLWFFMRLWVMSLSVLVSVTGFISIPASALPEFAADGYFSCTSCHVSTSGGDLVTSYGRSFAEEKLAWQAFEGEGAPGHGSVKLPEWLLLGGHYRQIQVHYEDARNREGHFFNMQRELDIGAQGAGLWTYATFSQKREDQLEYDAGSLVLRKFLVRFDIAEPLSVRYGLLMPKFGLNIPDHNAFVRSRMGLGPEAELGLVEASWFSETFEVNLAHAADVPHNRKYMERESGEYRDHSYGNISVFLAEMYRVSLSGLQRLALERKETGASLSFTGPLSDRLRLAAETSGLLVAVPGTTTRSSSLYSQFTWYGWRGFYPGFRYEQHTSQSEAADEAMDRFAVSLAIHPRPHFEFSGSLGTRRNLRDYTFGHTAHLMFHYWL